MNKIVVSDIDDVLVGFIPLLCSIYNVIHSTHLSPFSITNFDFENSKFFDDEGNEIDGDLLYKTMWEYHPYLCERTVALKYVKESLEKILKKGYDLVYLTARPATYKQETINMIGINEFPEGRLIMNKNKAGVICGLEKEVELFVDDNINNCLAVKALNKVPHVLVMDQPHNRSFDEKQYGIVRIFSMLDAVKLL